MNQLHEYKCPCCGGAVNFDSGIQKMKCPYCEAEFEMEALKLQDEEKLEEAADQMEWEKPDNEWSEEEGSGMKVYSCNSCGGQIVVDETTAASSCPYCGNPIIMTGNVAGELKPDLVIPFKLDKKAAKAALEKHLKGKLLLPKIFRDTNHIEEIKGIYVPFWLFDSDVNADIRYRATRTRIWSDRKYNYTETSHFSVYRSGNIGFSNVPVDGSKKMADDLMESIEPFNLDEAVDFQTAYLAGYLADKYDVTADESINRANERVKKSTEDAFADTVNGYETVIAEASSLKVNNGITRYALLPVWLLTTKWNNQTFTFAMNGQTGKFAGNLPLDKTKFGLSWLLSALGIGAAAFSILSLIL